MQNVYNRTNKIILYYTTTKIPRSYCYKIHVFNYQRYYSHVQAALPRKQCCIHCQLQIFKNVSNYVADKVEKGARPHQNTFSLHL